MRLHKTYLTIYRDENHRRKDRERNIDIRAVWKVEDIVRWEREKKRRYWCDHADRLNQNRLANIAKDENQQTNGHW